MKKVLLSFCVLLTLFVSHALAIVKIDGIYYDLNGNSATVNYNPNDKYVGQVDIPAVVEYDNVVYNVTAITYNTFCNCPDLTGVSIPASVTDIDYPLFAFSENLVSVVVDPANEFYDSRGDCNAVIEKERNALLAGCKATVIPDDVEEIYYEALSFKSLTGINIPASVRILQPAVFTGSGLTSIFIPATLQRMFDNPFRNCKDLTSIEVADDSPYYESRGCNAVFNKYNELVVTCSTSIIPDDITAIGSWAFADRWDLTSFSVPDKVIEISDRAFYNCQNLASVTIPNAVKQIGVNAFSWCQSLTSVHIGSGIERIDDGAFASCVSLDEVYVDATIVPQIYAGTFADINPAAKIYVPAEALAEYQSAQYWNTLNLVGTTGKVKETTFTFNGVAPLEVSGTTKYAYLQTEEGNDWYGVFFDSPIDQPFNFAIFDGESCAMIGGTSGIELANCFIENNQSTINGTIKKVIVRAAGDVKAIMCTIETVKKQEATYIEYEVQEEAYVETQGSDFKDYTFTFAGKEYTDAKVCIHFSGPSPAFIHSITVVHDDGQVGPALSGITGDVTWEATKLEQTYAIWENGSIVEKPTYRITLTGNGSTADYESNWNPTTGTYDHTAPWYSLGIITEVIVNEGVTRIGSEAFSHQEFLSVLTLPSSLRTISYYAFSSDTGLEEVVLPDQLQAIENYGFGFCSRLKSLHIPASVVTLYAHSFQGTNFERLTIASENPKYYSPEGSLCIIVKETNELLFGSPKAVIPNAVTSIGNYAFYNSYLTEMVIPNSVTSIGDRAFYYCNQLVEMEVPSSVTTIGNNAFSYCNAMTKFTIGSGVTTIGKEQFLTTFRNGVVSSVLADVYCYADPATLTWSDYSNSNFFMPDKATKFHVSAAYLNAWQTLFPDINATYVADLDGEVEPINQETTVNVAEEAKSGEAVTTNTGITISLGANDVVDREDGSVTVTTVMSTSEILDILENQTPASSDFTKVFKGIYFLLSAGLGHIDVECMTLGDYQLTVKEGSNTVSNYTSSTKGKISINYDAQTDEWVLIFPTVTAEAKARARAHKAPEEYTGGLKIYSVTVVPGETVDGIRDMKATDISNARIYNLSGQQTESLTRGIYIVNGRKVVVR